MSFWELPPCPLLNMASQNLSILSSIVTKATLAQVSKTLRDMESQDIFSFSIRDDMVQTVLREIRKKYPEEILLNKIANFAPELLRTIVDVAKNTICKIFKPPFGSPPVSDVIPNEEPSSKGLPMSNVLYTEEPPFETESEF